MGASMRAHEQPPPEGAAGAAQPSGTTPNFLYSAAATLGCPYLASIAAAPFALVASPCFV